MTTATRNFILTMHALDSKSYRTDYGWRFDNEDVYQGEWGAWGIHTGFWYFGDMLTRTLPARKDLRMRAYIKRRNSGGNYGEVPIFLYVHDHEEHDGEPTLLEDIEPVVVRLKRGGGDWVTLPERMVHAFQTGRAKGIAVHAETGGDYYAVLDPAASLTIDC